MKTCNLDYLKSHSANNPKFVIEMIQMFLKDTPEYISEMKKCLAVSDWKGLHKYMHKIRPSIDLIGMPKEIGSMAKQIDEYCREQTNLELIPEMFTTVDQAFTKVYVELENELKILNTSTPL
jgi:HPt (histidine-containing phosphotransfer) domain-containing protein